MNSIKYLDRSTRTLVFFSTVGVVLSILTWNYLEYFHASDQGMGQLVAELHIYKNDARVKRSGNVHWFPVNRDLDCFANDLVFTGEDSIAGVVYPKGDSVLLAPNTLISLAAGRVVLESGTIDVNITGGEHFQVESFGKVMAFATPGKLRIVNTPDEKSITSVEGDLLKGRPELNSFTTTPPLTLVTPTTATAFPRLKQSKIDFAWNDRTPKMAREKYKLEFSQTKAFRNVISTHLVDEPQFSISALDFPNGAIFMRVSAEHAPHLNHVLESYFIVHSDFDIEYKSPEDFSVFPFKEDLATLEFKWKDPLKMKNKIQVATDPYFKNISMEKEVSAAESISLALTSGGQYYWRIGHVFADEVVWAKGFSRFDLQQEKKIYDIYLQNIQNEFDFAVANTFAITINDLNRAKNYNVVITQAQKVISQTKLARGPFTLNKLPDGEYSIKVSATLEDGNNIESRSYTFKVKTSKPLDAPKVKSGDKNIFVRLLNLIIAPVHADELIPVEWQDSDADAYEIQLLSEDKVVHSRRINQTYYRIPIKKPGVYQWRIRRKKGKLWSPFSRETKIIAKDKVLTIIDPLMDGGAKVDYVNREIVLNWNEPLSDVKYFLEIYNSDQITPIESVSVKGGSHKMKFMDEPGTYRWRVYAQSPYGTKSKNSETSSFTVTDREFFNISAELSFVNSSQQQEIVSGTSLLLNRTNSFSGQTMLASYERRLMFLDYNFDGEFGFRYTNLADGANTYQSKDFLVELGVPFLSRKNSSHFVYLGGQISLVDLSFSDNVKYSYLFNYGTTRYRYTKNINEYSFYTFNAKGLLFIDLENPRVSLQLRPAYHYKFKKDIIFSAFMGIERNTVYAKKVKGSVSGDLDISNNIVSFGTRIYWLY